MSEQQQAAPICILILSRTANPFLVDAMTAARGHIALICSNFDHAIEAANRDFVPDIVVVLDQDSGTIARLRAQYSQRSPQFVCIGPNGQVYSGVNSATAASPLSTVALLTELFERIRTSTAGTLPDFPHPKTDSPNLAG